MPGDLVFAAAIDELLRQRQRHRDVGVIQLLGTLQIDARHIHADDIWRTGRGRTQQIELRRCLHRSFAGQFCVCKTAQVLRGRCIRR